MSILTRYILKEVLAHGLIGMAVFTFVVFMRDVGRILEVVVRNSAPLWAVVQMFLLTLPMALTVTLPMGVLVGILIGLSRLAADSEVTAMRAAGMGVWRFVRVIALFAIAVWLIATYNSVVTAPRSASALADLTDQLKTSQASFEIQPRVFYEDFKNLVLYVQDVQSAAGAAVWKGIFLADVSTPTAPRIILAEQGIITQENPDLLRLHLRNGTQHEGVARRPAQYSISTFQETDIPIPVRTEAASPRRISRRELTSSEMLERARQHPDPSMRRYYQVEFQRRLALPAACLVLAMVGIPLGLSAHKGGKSTGFVLTIALVFAYYFVSLVGVSLGRQGRLPPALGAWSANLVFFVVGLGLLWRVDRMPVEIGSVRALWTGLRRRLRRAKEGPSAFERAASRRRVFTQGFPQILDDYVLRDFGLYLGLILSAFVVLFLVFNFFEIIREIMANRVSGLTVAEYLVMLIPYTIYLLTPLAAMLAVLVTFGLLQKGNEVTAMKATGISIYRVVLPVLVAAALLSVGLFLFENFYLPDANRRQAVLRDAIEGRPPQTYLRPDRKWIFGQHSNIYFYEFYDPDQDRFGNISAFEFDPRTFEVTRRVFAARADWHPDLQRWVFEQGWVRSFRGDAIQEYRTFDVATFEPLNEPPSYFKKEVRQYSEMNWEELRRYIQDLQQSGFEVVRLRVQLHKKFAYPLITLVMAVLAVPFALTAGRRGALAGVAVAIGIAVLYWVTSGLFEALGNVNQLPPALAAWAPDIIFALIGGYLILKVPT